MFPLLLGKQECLTAVQVQNRILGNVRVRDRQLADIRRGGKTDRLVKSSQQIADLLSIYRRRRIGV